MRYQSDDPNAQLRDLDPEFIAEIKKVTLKVKWGVELRDGQTMLYTYKRWLLWEERDRTKTPVPFLKTRHLHLILLKAETRWRNENKAGIWRLSQMPYILEEFEYRKRLDNNPVIT